MSSQIISLETFNGMKRYRNIITKRFCKGMIDEKTTESYNGLLSCEISPVSPADETNKSIQYANKFNLNDTLVSKQNEPASSVSYDLLKK